MTKKQIVPAKTVIVLTITDPKAIPLVTETVMKKKAILKNSKGDWVELKPHQLKKELVTFLEKSGLTFEYSDVPSRRGRSEIEGVIVRVKPANGSNYDFGTIIKINEPVDESGKMDKPNSRIVKNFLVKSGVDLDKRCKEGTEELSCLTKMKED